MSCQIENPTKATTPPDTSENMFGLVYLSELWHCECLRAALATLFGQPLRLTQSAGLTLCRYGLFQSGLWLLESCCGTTDMGNPQYRLSIIHITGPQRIARTQIYGLAAHTLIVCAKVPNSSLRRLKHDLRRTLESIPRIFLKELISFSGLDTKIFENLILWHLMPETLHAYIRSVPAEFQQL